MNTEAPATERIAGVADRMYPGKLWGHSMRGLVWNPIFAMLPVFYLARLQAATSTVMVVVWLTAFLLGFPHASYTAMEIRHYLVPNDGVADGRSVRQLGFFLTYLLLGAGLAVWYVAEGAQLLARMWHVDPRSLMLILAASASLGAVMGIQDVLVADLLLHPRKVVRSAFASVTRWRWLRIVLGWTVAQLLLAEAALHLWP